MIIEPFLTAIVFVPDPGTDPKAYKCKKYVHNIKNTPWYVGKFCNDLKRKFPTAEFINFYYKRSQTFKEKIYLE